MDSKGFVCPCCSEDLAWSAENGIWTCARCHHTFEDALIRQYHQASVWTKAPSRLEWEPYTGVRSGRIQGLVCPACGLTMESAQTDAALRCPGCGASELQSRTFFDGYRPDGIIPFTVGQEKAMMQFRRFLRHKPLLPRRFALKRQTRSMTGVYVPCWLFGCQAGADLAYSATRNVTWREEKYQVTRTDHFLVRRRGSMEFGPFGVDAASRLGLSFPAGAYDMTQMAEYTPGGLADNLAVRGDLGPDAGIKRANERIETRIRAAFKQTTPQYDCAMLKNAHVEISQGQIRYVWLPVWHLNCQYRGRTYSFQVNGQTGQVAGDLPVSITQCIFWTVWIGMLAALALLALAAVVKMEQLGPENARAWWNSLLGLTAHWPWFAAGGLAVSVPVVLRKRYLMAQENKKTGKATGTQEVGFQMEYAQDLLMYSTTSRTRVEADVNRRIQRTFKRKKSST